MTRIISALRPRLALAVMAGALALGARAEAQNPRVRIDTDAGAITVELYPDKAPVTVANFLKYVNGKLYDGGAFYRVVQGAAPERYVPGATVIAP